MRLTNAWRLISVILLALYVVLAAAFVLLFLRNIGLAILVGATTSLVAYAIWLIFTGTGKQSKLGRWLVIMAGLALAAELFYFLFDARNRRVVAVIILISIVYFLLYGLLRKKYLAEARLQGGHTGRTAHFKKPFLIINPVAGNGRSIKAGVDKLAKQQGITVIITKKGVDISEFALEAIKKGADVIGISGGDGSIGAVAKVAIEHSLPIVVLPGGTKCHFARDIGLDPKLITDALAGFTGVERKLDVGEINGRIFLNNASFGLYADIVDHPDYREHKVRVSRKVLQEMVAGTKKPYDLRFTDGAENYTSAAQILVGINRYNTMSLLELGHRHRLDEGILQVTAITEINNLLAWQMIRAFGFKQIIKRGNMPGLHQWVCETFIVKSGKKEIVVGIDGERETYKTPVKIHILPGRLRIYVPAEGVRGRRKNPLSYGAVRKIKDVAKQS